MTFRTVLVGVAACLVVMTDAPVRGDDIIEDFTSVTSNLNIAAEPQSSSAGLVKHPDSTYAWGGWNNAPAASSNSQLRYASSAEVQYRGMASEAGTYVISRFDVTCELGVIEFNQTRSSRKVGFLVRDAATQNWYISDSVEQGVARVRHDVTALNWWPVTDGNAELNGDTFVPLSFGAPQPWAGLTIDAGGVHCDGEGASPLEWNLLMFLEAGSNQPPEVEAGPDRETSIPEGGRVALAGSALDDGNPAPPGALTLAWSVLSGPEGATVTFDPGPDVADPNAVFDTPGEYTLQLEADDGQLQAADTVAVVIWAKKFETIVLTPEDDTFIRQNRVDNTHGDHTNLRVRADGNWTSYLKFDMWRVPGNPVSATLRLYAKDGMPDARVFSASFGPSGEWFEETLSWASSDIVNGDVLAEISPIAGGQYYEFNVADMFIESDGWATLGATSSSGTNTDFSSKEDVEEQRPQLIVLYDAAQASFPLPEPGAVNVHPGEILNWIPGAGSTQDQVFFGTDPNLLALVGTVTVTGDPKGEVFDPLGDGELEIGQTYYWQIVASSGAASPVWSFTVIQVHPSIPASVTPEDGAVGLLVPDDVALRYTTLPDAAPDAYHLYVSSEAALVESLDPGVRVSNVHVGYDEAQGIDARGVVDYAPLTTYHYRFEGTRVGGGSWSNVIQSFTTAFFVGVEEFENGLVDGNRGVTWAGDAAVGAAAHTGLASLQLDYAAGSSSASGTFDRPRDWDDANIAVLTLFVRGSAGNAEAALSVTLEDASTASGTVECTLDVTDEDPWQAVNIDVAEFGIDLAAVKKLTVTVSGEGAGTLLLDDIRLYAPVDETGLLGFIARYPFDTNGRDAGPNNLDLELHTKGTGSYEIDADTAVGAGSFRIHGSGIDFQNGAYARRPGDDNLEIETAVTVSLWMKEDGTQADNPWAGLFGEGLDNPSYMRKQSFQVLRASNSRLRWKCNRLFDPNATGEDKLWYYNSQDGPDTRDGKWHHVVATYDSTVGHTLYVDGLERAFAPSTGLIDDPADGAGIMVGAKDWEEVNGSLTGDPTHFFFGWIDEIVVYDRALSAAEIDLIFRQGAVLAGDHDGDGVIDPAP